MKKIRNLLWLIGILVVLSVLIDLPKESRIQELINSLNEAKDTFDDAEFIRMKHHEFLQAVQQQDPKAHPYVDEADWVAHGSPIWNEASTFDEWLDACKGEIVIHRIEELQKKRKGGEELSAFQKSIAEFADEMKFEDELEMMKFDKIYYDVMEFLVNKGKEAIDRYNKGLVKILEKDLLADELDYELGKTALNYVPKENKEGLVKLNK